MKNDHSRIREEKMKVTLFRIRCKISYYEQLIVDTRDHKTDLNLKDLFKIKKKYLNRELVFKIAIRNCRIERGNALGRKLRDNTRARGIQWYSFATEQYNGTPFAF